MLVPCKRITVYPRCRGGSFWKTPSAEMDCQTLLNPYNTSTYHLSIPIANLYLSLPMLSRLFSLSRYIIGIAVLGSFVAAVILMVYGAAELVTVTISAFAEGTFSSKGAKTLALTYIEIVDLFLLATVFYIIALGLYELFIDTNIVVPPWLEIRTLDDLKNKLTSVVVVVMGVLFLGQVVTWDGQRDLLGYGVAIGAVIVALTFFLRQQTNKK